MPRCPICGDEIDPATGNCGRAHSPAPPGEVPAAADAVPVKRPGRRWHLVLIAAYVGAMAACGGLIVPAVFQAREAARRSQSKNNLKQIGLAISNYYDGHKVLPPGGIFDAKETPFFSWLVSIMPYMDASPRYNAIDFNVPWNDARNEGVFRRPYPYYLNPSIAQSVDSQGFVLSHYAANKNVMFANSSMSPAEITDGLAQTILAGEIAEGFRPYAQPGNWRDPAVGINAGRDSFGRPSGDGVCVLMADGSVRWLTNSIDRHVLRALSTPAGGETVSELP